MYKAVKDRQDVQTEEDAPGTSYNQKIPKLFICCVSEYLNLTVASTCHKAIKCMWIQHTVHKICMHIRLQIFLMQSVLKQSIVPKHCTTFLMNGS